MDNLIVYIAIIVSLLIGVYLLMAYLLWSKTHKKSSGHVEITGQRERIEDKVYELQELLFSDVERMFDSGKLLLEFPEKDLSINSKIPNYSFFENFGIDMSNIHVSEKTAFCLMPFHKKFDKIYTSIKAACSQAGYACLRSDEPFNPGNVLRQILQMMTAAEIIIAVLDGKNPNVFYEIGLAHSLGKTVILVGNAKNPDDISFDLKSERLILYNNPGELQQKLASSLKQLHYV